MKKGGEVDVNGEFYAEDGCYKVWLESNEGKNGRDEPDEPPGEVEFEESQKVCFAWFFVKEQEPDAAS